MPLNDDLYILRVKALRYALDTFSIDEIKGNPQKVLDCAYLYYKFFEKGITEEGITQTGEAITSQRAARELRKRQREVRQRANKPR